MENDKTFCFWTGGWDSTFRMLQLANSNGKIIQPLYVSGNGRKSENIEIQTMNKMLPLIRNVSKSEICDLNIIKKSEIPINNTITESYNRIRELVRIGAQYEWLARLAKEYGCIEIGIEKPNGEFVSTLSYVPSNRSRSMR